MTDEYEVSFVVPAKDAFSIAEYLRMPESNSIIDYYFEPEARIRRILGNPKSVVATIKDGIKADGHRIELNTEIECSPNFINWMRRCSKLEIKKERHTLSNGKIVLSIDTMLSPINVGIIELETQDKSIAAELEKKVKKSGIVNCELNAWNYCKRKIAIAGGPSSGKTSVAKAVSLALNNTYNANSSDVVEYATSFIQKQARIPSFEDQAWINKKQQDREDAVARTANIVISDCPSLLAYIYARHAMSKRKADPHSDFAMQSLYKDAVRALNRYSEFYLLETISYKENGVRYHSREQSKGIFKEIHDFIVHHGRGDDIVITDYNEVEAITNKILRMNKNPEAILEYIRSNFKPL